MNLWIVSRIRRGYEHNFPEIKGVFDTQEAAKAICENEEFVIFPCKLNELILNPWIDACRPVDEAEYEVTNED